MHWLIYIWLTFRLRTLRELVACFRSCDSRKSHLTGCQSRIDLLYARLPRKTTTKQKTNKKGKHVVYLVIFDWLHVYACIRLLTSSLLLVLLDILASRSVLLSEERMASPTLRWVPGFHEPEETGRSHKNSSSRSDRKAAKGMIHFILEPRPFWWRKYRKIVLRCFGTAHRKYRLRGIKKSK